MSSEPLVYGPSQCTCGSMPCHSYPCLRLALSAPLQGTVVSPLSPVSQPGSSALTKQVADLQAELAKLRANTVSTSSAGPAGQPAVGLGLLAAVVTFVLVR